MSATQTKKARVVFFGAAPFSLAPLLALANGATEILAIVTQPDKPFGRGKKLAENVVKKWAVANNVAVFQPDRINRADFIEMIRALQPDLFVVVAYGKILPADLLEIPNFGSLNVHGSLLPKYRGASPVQTAILSGDAVTGATIMLLDQKMDTGPILAQKEIPIAPDETSATLAEKLSQTGAKLLAETIPLWLDGKITATPQKAEEASVCGKITKDDGKIDWHEPAQTIERKIRAFQPWPVANTWSKDKKYFVKIHRAKISAQTPSGKQPGDLFIAPQNTVHVCCGQNTALELLAVQPQNKNIMPAYDFLLGRKELLTVGFC